MLTRCTTSPLFSLLLLLPSMRVKGVLMPDQVVSFSALRAHAQHELDCLQRAASASNIRDVAAASV